MKVSESFKNIKAILALRIMDAFNELLEFYFFRERLKLHLRFLIASSAMTVFSLVFPPIPHDLIIHSAIRVIFEKVNSYFHTFNQITSVDFHLTEDKYHIFYHMCKLLHDLASASLPNSSYTLLFSVHFL